MESGPCPDGPRGCEIGELFDLLSKTHMLDLLHVFIRSNDGPKRFIDLQKQLGLSPNTLSARLKSLVAAGIITRTAFNEIPPRVDYEATPKGRDLCTVFEALRSWSDRHALVAEVVAA